MLRLSFVLLGVAVTAAVGVSLWVRQTSDTSQASSARTATVVRRDFTTTVLATGAVKAQVGAEVRVGARASGKVERLHANIGDVVQKGQVLAELEKSDIVATLDQRRAELEMAKARLSSVTTLGPREVEKAQADVAQRQATLDLAGKDLLRQEDLLKQEFTTRQARDQAYERWSVAKAQSASTGKSLDLAKARYSAELREAKADIARAEAALANAQALLSFTTITAPIDGVIASVATQEGETVSAGLNAPTFVTIIDLKRLQMDAFVDEVDIGKVEVGQEAVFAVDAYPGNEFKGRVSAIYPKAVIQENVVNYDVVVEITLPYDGLLRPEMTTSVTIFLETRENVLTVPIKAAKRERGRSVVYILTNGQPQPREVKVGWKDSQWIEVLSGVGEGETILLDVPSAEQPKP
jgi:multidrug efflux pump subunit AcrA (membrane-fusion protein)